MIRRILLLVSLACLAVTDADARLFVTTTLCNYQTEPTALVEPGERIRVGWQYTDADRASAPIQDSYQLTVTERITGRPVFNSGTVNSQESQFIELPALPHNRYGYSWQVRIGKDGEWSTWSRKQTIRVMPDMGEPQWIGAITKAAAHIPTGRWSNEVFKKDTFKTKWDGVDELSAKSIILRKKVSLPKKVTDAVLYVSGLGHYELRIDGNKIGNSEFAPLWSEYSRTVYYNVFDVTTMLQQGGAHAVTILLGNGFFNVQRGGRYSKLQTSFGPPQLFFRLDITYTDGTTAQVRCDDTWRWTLSPITFNSIYGGESYDARLEQPAETDWHPVVLTEGPAGSLRAETSQPVRVMERHDVQTWKYIDPDSLAAASAKTRRNIAPGTFVCDMGQNLSGFPEIVVSGKAGQTVTLLVSERLTPQGACDQSQTGRQHYYEYTLRGAQSEAWHPRFSYYGFRYIQVEGAVLEGQPNPHGLPVLHSLQSAFVYNSAPEGSAFWCNNERFTRTHRLIERAERSNMQAVMTDCPHREKLGWLEQDHLCGPSLLYNYDMTRLVPKIIRDITDTQEPNGFVPTTAPRYVSFGSLFDDSPEWGSTLVILPFLYYDMYGDSTLIVDNYDAMRRYVDYLTSRSDDGIVSHGLGDWYDYGPWRAGFSRNTPVPLVATAHYIYDLQLVSEAARMAGREKDALRYRQRYDKVVNSFNRHFYHADSCYYGTNSQCSNALPLFLGIAPDKDGVLRSLIDDIHAHGDRLTTGDVGNRYLFRVLADNGYGELLFRMLNHDETPGYGFQLAQGATTLTEQWDPRQGSSENHFMLGQIDEWLFHSLSGIRQQPGTHGMRHLVIDPQLVGDITQLRTTITTLFGPVTVSYDKASRDMQVNLPGGCDIHPLAPEAPSTSASIIVTPGSSLHEALRQAREWRRTGDARCKNGITIIVRGGRHYMHEPLFLRPEDSGTADSPLVIRGEDGAVICGDEPQQHTQLWPREGMAPLLAFDTEKRTVTIPVSSPGNQIPSLLGEDGDARPLEMLVHQRWATAILRVKDIIVHDGSAVVSFHEPESRLEFEHPWPQPVICPPSAPTDGQGGKSSSFLLRTTEQRDGVEQLIIVNGASHVTFENITFENTCWNRPLHRGHVTLQGGFALVDAYKLKQEGLPWDKTLENQAWVERPVSAVSVSNAHHVDFTRCTFRHMGATALDYVDNTSDCTIHRNTFSDIGGTAVMAGSFAESPREVHRPYTDLAERCQRLTISNNRISDAACEDWGAVAIGCGYVRDVVISGNDIERVNYSGICVGWGWTAEDTGMRNNHIYNNNVRDYARQLYDAGGIYTLSNQPGSTIRDNVVSQPAKAPYATNNRAFCIYLDARTDGYTISGNTTEGRPIRRDEIGDNQPGSHLVFK